MENTQVLFTSLKRKARLLPILCFLTILLVSSCARPKSPTGGEKDEIPPKLVQVNPKSGSLNFKGTEITMEFDEYVKLDKVKKELSITPRINNDFEYKQNKETIELSNLELEDSTTYTFNFGNSVKDITEGNIVENMIVFFSTGDYLDSLSINGTIKNLMTDAPISKATVALYEVGDTLDIFTGKARYAIKSDEKGFYQFNNIKNGKYFLYAYNDKNINQTCQADKGEAFGFISDTLNLQENVDSLHIQIRNRNIKPLKMLKARASGKYFEVKFNKYMIEYDLKSTDSTKIILSNLTDENHAIRIYNTLPINDSLRINLTATDSVGQKIDSTFYLKFIESNRKIANFSSTLSKSQILPSEIFNGKIVFSKPITTIITDSLYFQYDSLTFEKIDTLADFTWNKNRTILTIKKQLHSELYKITADTVKKDSIKSKTKKRVPGAGSFSGGKDAAKVTLYLGNHSFISIDSDTSQVMQKNLRFSKENSFGIIKGTIQTNYKSYTIQLLTKKYVLVSEQKNVKKFEFRNIDPSEYRIRILIDENENGSWEIGDIKTFTKPEPIFHLDKIIPIRANWETVENIKF